jgi:hypothetical protein
MKTLLLLSLIYPLVFFFQPVESQENPCTASVMSLSVSPNFRNPKNPSSFIVCIAVYQFVTRPCAFGTIFNERSQSCDIMITPSPPTLRTTPLPTRKIVIPVPPKKVTNNFRMRDYKVNIDGKHFMIEGFKSNVAIWKNNLSENYYSIYLERPTYAQESLDYSIYEQKIEFIVQDCNESDCNNGYFKIAQRKGERIDYEAYTQYFYKNNRLIRGNGKGKFDIVYKADRVQIYPGNSLISFYN